MRCYKHFIFQVPKVYRDTIKTPSGIEVFLDRRWSRRDLVNTVVEVKNTPLGYDGPIEIGDTMFIDATILYNQVYKNIGEQQNINLLDKKKFLYKIEPNLILAYQKKGINDWIGYGEHVLIERIEEKFKSKIGSIHIPKSIKKKTLAGFGTVFTVNKDSINFGIEKGQSVYYVDDMRIDVKLGEKWYTWLRNKDILAEKLIAA